jgi:transposase InsO family protein
MFEELRKGGLLVPPLKAPYPRTTQSYHTLPVFGNMIKGMEVSAPNQVWVSDITYVRTREDFVYLALITDKYSRKVVGWHAGDCLAASGCVRALERALAQLPAGHKPIHHSDQGSQYCSHEYVDRLQKAGLGVSMTQTNHCAENALAERMNGILKQEYGLGQELPDKAMAYRAVSQSVHLYNTRRPHGCLENRTPTEVHQGFN